MSFLNLILVSQIKFLLITSKKRKRRQKREIDSIKKAKKNDLEDIDDSLLVEFFIFR